MENRSGTGFGGIITSHIGPDVADPCHSFLADCRLAVYRWRPFHLVRSLEDRAVRRFIGIRSGSNRSIDNPGIRPIFDKTKEEFDIIMESGSLHHIYDYLELIKESVKKLNSGGYYYILEEPLPSEKYNYYLGQWLRIWDKAYFDFKEKNIGVIKFLLYFI